MDVTVNTQKPFYNGHPGLTKKTKNVGPKMFNCVKIPVIVNGKTVIDDLINFCIFARLILFCGIPWVSP